MKNILFSTFILLTVFGQASSSQAQAAGVEPPPVTSDTAHQGLDQSAPPSPPGAQPAPITGATPIQPQPVYIVDAPKPLRKNRISFDPLGLLFGFGSVTYERALSDSFSLEVAPLFVYFGFGDDKIYGGGLSLGANFYPGARALEGVKISARVAPGFVTVDSSTSFILSAKALFGYQWIWRDGFSFALGGGVQYVHFNNEDVNSSFNGILPTLDANLGFAW